MLHKAQRIAAHDNKSLVSKGRMRERSIFDNCIWKPKRNAHTPTQEGVTIFILYTLKQKMLLSITWGTPSEQKILVSKDLLSFLLKYIRFPAFLGPLILENPQLLLFQEINVLAIHIKQSFHVQAEKTFSFV